MKATKRILALVLALAMVFALTATAFAEAGTITIKNSEDGTVYDFYKILNLSGKDTTSDGKYDAVSYTIATKWANFFKGTAAGTSYLVAEASATAEQKASLNVINFDGAVYYLNLTTSNVVAFTNAAMEYALTNSIERDYTTTGNGSDKTVSVDLGYYLMIPVDASTKNANSTGSVASLTSTVPSADILVKAEKPKVEKTDNAVSADLGQVVTYTVEGEVPNTAGYETYKYVLKDKMTSGLTFNKDVKVELEGTDITSQVTINYNDASYANGFTADIPVKNLQAYIGKKITLTYTATVNEDAVATQNEKNTVTLDYGHNPGDLSQTTPISEEVYTAKIVINKYTGDDAAAATGKLADAKFALMDATGKYYKYTAAVEDDPATTETNEAQPAKVEWVTITGAPTEGTSPVTDAMAKALAENEANFTYKATNANGAAEFPGIKDGTYYLVEYVAPTGYNRLDKPQAVTVAGTDVDDGTAKIENEANATGTFDEANNATADVQNKSGAILPSTGGIGTTIFYIVGGILVLGAGVVLIARRRMNADA